MNDILIFALLLFFGVLPLSLFVYWYKYRGTIIYKTAFAMLTSNILVAVGSFAIGSLGIKYVVWYIPLGYLALLLGNFVFKKFVQRPLKTSVDVLKRVTNGELDITIDENIKKNNDETGYMNIALDEIIHNLNDTAEFARQVGEGNFDHKIELLSESDHLRSALMEMRRKLQEAKTIQEERKIEEEKRSWANEGLANLNEILRKQDDVAELSYQILSFMINYLGANQGGIFIRNNEDQSNITLELQSFYAFNRRKYIKKVFELGEGLVGNCAFEKQTIHLTTVPDNYIKITSGMGGSNPRSLLLIPMKMEDEVLGVIEIASFNDFEDHQIEFVEQASLSIASSLNAAETNRHTSELLERTQQQAEEMSAQEEEMRQNMEELQSTQEESGRRELEYQEILQVLTASTYNIEYDMTGKITDINEPFANMIGLPKQQIIGLSHKDGIEFTDESLAEYNKFWDDLKNGKQRKEITKHLKKDKEDEHMWLSELYTPIVNDEGEVYKVMKIAFDVTDIVLNKK